MLGRVVDRLEQHHPGFDDVTVEGTNGAALVHAGPRDGQESLPTVLETDPELGKGHRVVPALFRGLRQQHQ